jgi:murein L,D-transpeptidase YafK
MRKSLLAVLMLAAWATRADAVVVELKDVAADRIERQRAASQGNIPLPNTPNIAQLDQRLAEKGVKLGSELMVRIFKAESALELWMKKGDRFVHFATYPICYWSGTLGPKVTEGDQQSPEGIYTVTSRQLHLIGRWPRSINLGFPNSFDRSYARTGSYILVHGGCSSVGCYSLTNPVIEEVYSIIERALKGGQDHIQVQVFPFRLTEENLRGFVLHEWYDFWRNLKDAYDSFERTKLPPRVSVCERRYWVEDAARPGEVAAQSPLAGCGVLSAATEAMQEEMATAFAKMSRTSPLYLRSKLIALQNLQNRISLVRSGLLNARLSVRPNPQPSVQQIEQANALSNVATTNPRANGTRSGFGMTTTINPGRSPSPAPTSAGTLLRPATGSSPTTARVQISCEETLPSCRRWIALQTAMVARRRSVASGTRAVRPNRS